MKSLTNSFFLLASPSPGIAEDVTYFKNQVWKCIGHSYQSLYSKAHLTFLQYEDYHNESRLYAYEDAISCVKSFIVYIKGFSCFKNNGTIFLNPYAPELYDLSEKLKNRRFVPHITIARNLKPIDFDKAWRAVGKFSYSNSFECKCITVLKRIDNRWQPHVNLPLAQ